MLEANDGFLQLWQAYCDKKEEVEGLKEQRAELLGALKAAQKKGSRWHPADPVVQQINAAITKAEAAE